VSRATKDTKWASTVGTAEGCPDVVAAAEVTVEQKEHEMAGNCYVRYAFAFLALIALFATSAPAQQVPKVGFVDFQGSALAGEIKHFRDGMTALGQDLRACGVFHGW
jgi:hypothetical protein